jgi:hypothetical protein
LEDEGSASTPCSVPVPPSPDEPTLRGDPRRSVQARLAVALLETLQRRDRPEEVLVDENLSVTLPRRLGLSHVVLAQLQRYREEARRNHGVREPEVFDLLHLVARRPDAAEVFHEVGRALAEGLGTGWRRALPRRFVPTHVRRRGARLLGKVFGVPVLRRDRTDPVLALVHPALLASDPEAPTCALVTGALEGVAERSARIPLRVRKVACRLDGAEVCLWEVDELRPELVRSEGGEGESGPEAATAEDGPGSESESGGAARSA